MNVHSGIGAGIDAARKGMRCVDRSFSEDVPQEIRRLPLAPGTPLRALVQGAPCSLNEHGEIQQFDPSKPFGGFVITLIDDGVAKVAVYARGAVMLRVDGLTLETRMGALVYAASEKQFSTDVGGAVIGQLLEIESLDKGLALVGFKRAADARPFGESGKLVERF